MSKDILRDELIAITSDLIRFQSTADQPDQLAAIMNYVTDYVHQSDGLFIYPSMSQGKSALTVTLHDTHTPTIMFNGHLDVVPANPEQFEPRIDGDRLYGRGSQDMKSGVAVMLRLLRELAQHDPRPNIGMQFVTDEEIGGYLGTCRLLNEDHWRCQFFIACEPTDLRICYAQKGLMWFQIRLRGHSSHASRPWQATNPLFALASGIRELQQRFPPLTTEQWASSVTPTNVATTNTAQNKTPADAIISFDVRCIPEDSPSDIVAAVMECFPDGELLNMRQEHTLTNDLETPLIRAFADTAAQVCGEAPTFYREHFSSDARFYGQASIPSICYGAVGAGLHSDDEWVSCESLVTLYHVLHYFCNHVGEDKIL